MEIERLSTFTASQLVHARSLDFVRIGVAGLAYDDGGAPRSLSNAVDLRKAFEYHANRWPRSLSADLVTKGLNRLITKAAVNPGTTTEPSWAAPLAAVRPFSEAFVEFARPKSLIGKLMASARRVPFNVSVPVASGGGTYRWVGQGAPKPVGNLALASVTLPILKSAGIVIVTNELIRLSSPGAEVVVRNDMITGMSQYLDGQLTDPTVAGVSGVSPASITNAAPSIASAGTSAANAATDVKLLIETFTATNPNASSLALLMSPGVAVAVAIASNSQTLGPNGGRLFGIDVFTGAIGSRVVILDPSALLIADDGELDITVARHASVEMEGTATSPQTASTVLVNLWSAGLCGLKIDRLIGWRMARASAVLFTNVSYT